MIDETNLVRDLPRLRLTALPTPLDRAERLEEALSAADARPPRIYIKRDDLLSLALGGNKVRNLEFSLGAAIADGATDVVTMGRAQSNHCRLTAAACARTGLRAHLVMSGGRTAVARGNLLLSELLGAAVHFTGTEERLARDAAAERICEEIVSRGGKPVILPVGGSDPRGAVGHAVAAVEIAHQCDEIGENPDALVLATATGGTQAGLVTGFRALHYPVAVHGFSVHKPGKEASRDVRRLAQEVAALIGAGTLDGDAIRVDDSELGPGYGAPSDGGQAAVTLLARAEGLVADPVYTGKALAGLIAMISNGRLVESSSVVFIHTGGTPALFADLAAPSA